MSNPRQFQVYGAVLETTLDLHDYLLAGESGRYRLTLCEHSDGASLSGLDVCTPFFSSHGRKLFIYSDRDFTGSEKGKPWCLDVDGVVRFYWVCGQTRIDYEVLERCTDQLLAFWLIHIFLPLFFTLEGLYEFIHACAVEIAGGSILFVAPSTGGKSTLTDFFLKQGHRLISDDKVATYLEDGTYFAVPSHPNHRPYRKFEDLGYRVEDFSAQGKAIDAFYVLNGVDPESEVTVREVNGHQKFARLLPNHLFNFSFLMGERLKYLAEMASSVPIYQVDVPWDLDRLKEVHDVINEHRREQ